MPASPDSRFPSGALLRAHLALTCALAVPATSHAAITTTGDVSPDPAITTAQDNLYIGESSDGTIRVDAGDTLFSNNAYLGVNAGVHGEATIDGADSSWILEKALTIGAQGTGQLIVSGGARAELGALRIGFESMLPSEVTVSGDGSQIISGGLQFWDTGTVAAGGTLRVEEGGYYASGGSISVLSSLVDTGSHIEIVGTGSRWEHRYGAMSIGNGSVSVLDGGVVTFTGGVSDVRINVGDTLTVSGAGSHLSTQGDLHLSNVNGASINIGPGAQIQAGRNTIAGYWGQYDPEVFGRFIFDGGTLTTGALMVGGDQLVGVGTVNTKGLVTDTSLQFNATRGAQQQVMIDALSGQMISVNLDLDGTAPLGAGFRAQGTTTITEGFTATSTEGYVGYQPSADGLVVVEGVGSRWDVLYDLRVGERGKGTLRVVDQGVVKANSLRLGMESTAAGTVVVAGAGSKIEASSARVGVLGEAVLEVREGAVLETLYGVIGDSLYPGPERTSQYHAEVIIDGEGSMWTANGGLNVGYEGHGKLTVTNGGVIHTAGSASVGHKQSSIGEVQVIGEASAWTIGEEMLLGYRGQASVQILAGGRIRSGRVRFDYSTEQSYATVDGAGSEWVMEGDLRFESEGSFYVTGGARVSTTSARLEFASEPGAFTVSGSGSEFLIGELLEIERPFDVLHGGYVRSADVVLNGDAAVRDAQSRWEIQGGLRLGERLPAIVDHAGGLVEVVQDRLLISKEFAPPDSDALNKPVAMCACGGGPPNLGNGTYNLHAGVLDLHGNNIVLGVGEAVFNFRGGEVRNLGTMLNKGGALTSIDALHAMAFDGRYVQEENATLAIEIGGATPGAGYDAVDFEGDAQLAGTLDLALIDGFTPVPGQSFTVLTASTLNGTRFDRVSGVDLGAGRGLAVTYGEAAVDVTAALFGDKDLDGDIDDADLSETFSNYTGPLAPGTGGMSWAQGDNDGDGDVDDADLGTSFANYTGPTAAANVPEPASAALMGCGAFAVLRRRRGLIA